MKNYKFVVPIVLVALFILSIYMLYDTKANALLQYNEYLKLARDYRKQDIQVDAEENYIKALSINPHIELYIEIGQFYNESEQIKKATEWGNTSINKYPMEIIGYEFLMDLYIKQADYVASFKLLDIIEKRNLSSTLVDELISEIEYEYFFNHEFSDVGIYSMGLCPVKIEDKWGYVDLTGKKVIGNKFIEAGYHSGQLAPVIDSNGQAYFIDTNGNKRKVVLDLKNVRKLGLIENGVFSLYNGSSWGFYNDDNEHIFGEYEEVSAMGNGVAAVMKDNNWSLVDRDGKALSPFTYDGVVMDDKLVVSRYDRVFVYSDYYYHLIDTKGNSITNQKFQDARIFNDDTYAAVKIDGQWGFVDLDGNIKIEPKYEDARSFSNGYAAIKFAGKWGFIDMDNNIVIDPQFDDAKDFNVAGCVFVLQNQEWRLLRLFKYNH